MLTELFTSQTRIKLLLKLFLNPDVSCYLRELAKEFSVSPNGIKEELDSLSSAGYLKKEQNGRSIYFRANTDHPFFPEISSIVRKYLGIDRIIDQIMKKVGHIEAVYLLDDYALGKDTGIIDILVVGKIDKIQMETFRQSAEEKIKRKIRVMDVDSQEFLQKREMFLKRPHWQVV